MKTSKASLFVAALISVLFLTQARAAPTDLAKEPFTVGELNTKPNLMFVLDNSGSMDWDFLPDWLNYDASTSSSGRYCKRPDGTVSTSDSSSQCCRNRSGNGNSCMEMSSSSSFSGARGDMLITTPDINFVYYNPGIRYSPPINSDGTSKMDMSAANTTNWTKVPADAYGIQSSSSYKANLAAGYPDMEWCTDTGYTSCQKNNNYTLPNSTFSVFHAVTGNPYYYRVKAGEYCDSPKLVNCVVSNAPTGSYIYAAILRWCSDTNLTNCGAVRTSTYKYPRYPTIGRMSTATLTITGVSGNVSVTSVKANGVELLNAATGNNNTNNSVASAIVTAINLKTGTHGYSATRSSNVVTITASNANCALTAAPTTAKTGTATLTSSAFTGYCPVPGSFARTDITSAVTSYPKSAERTDCAGATCTYSEEMTNFANWFAYYRTRMQMMKSSTSLAFKDIDSRYRVGYMTINSVDSNYVKVDDFNSTQRSSWYSMLFAANPSGGTPLREALSNAGRLYAGKWKDDPVQYSCQQNFTLLSTDGYWNSNGGVKLDGSTAVGDQDSNSTTTSRPLLDGTATANTLSDVAYYYYQTDLRDPSQNNCTGAKGAGIDVCPDNVRMTTSDPNYKQHMTTFTLGLGIDGLMKFDPKYRLATSGDFADVKSGASASPGTGICTWQTSGTTCNWPVPGADKQENIDDLWHAAVNGRGTYFSATNPASLAQGLTDAFSQITAATGAAAAAATSSPNVTAGDNFVFSTTFKTQEWSGEVERKTINVSTGEISKQPGDWNAQAQLDSVTWSSRKIYTFDPSQVIKLKPFAYDDLSSAEQAYFDKTKVSTLTQGPALASANLLDSAAGKNLVNFLRGDRTYENDQLDANNNVTQIAYYRTRGHVLGDIVSAEAVYVKKPYFTYADAGYSDFVGANATRQAMVYVASNDGMLHAFNADTGAEAWAYVPSMVMSKLYKLADKNYKALHEYFVDATPSVADVCVSPCATKDDWRTILIGGLSGGGRGYYALDITDPANPKGLWEFTYDTTAGTGYQKDANLGYTYGNPILTKTADGVWSAVLSSGYNNISPGDGQGRLFVLDALSGAMRFSVATATGDTTTPSGLSRISGWAANPMYDNTTLRVYGGDLLGNLWRFDINNSIGVPGRDANKLAVFQDQSGKAQPVTAKPELGLVNNKYAVVLVGTGSLLGLSDLSQTNQSFYAVKDPVEQNSSDATQWGNIRGRTDAVKQTLVDELDAQNKPTGDRLVSNNAVDFETNSAWYIDLPDSGERANTDPTLALGLIVFTTNIPSNASCTAGGSSWLNYVDFATGGAIDNTNKAGHFSSGALMTRPVLARLPGGYIRAITTKSSGEVQSSAVPMPPPTGSARVFWREIFN